MLGPLAPVLLVLALSSTSLAQSGPYRRLAPELSVGAVHVVNDGGGSRFRTIQDAIDAALDGDTILVQSGTYAGFVLAGRSLSVVAELGAELRFLPLAEIVVEGLPAGRSVVLRGLRALAGEHAPRLVVRDAVGPVLVEDARFESPRMDLEAALVEDADALFLVRVDFAGGDSSFGAARGLLGRRSSLYVYESSATTGYQYGKEANCVPRDGVSGMRLADSYAFLSGVTIHGGDTPPCGSPSFDLGDGGAGLEIDGSVVESVGATLLGGQGGGDGFFCALTSAGPAIRSTGGSTYQQLGGTTHSLALPAPLREGTIALVEIQGEAGEQVFLHTAARLAAPVAFPGFIGPFLTLAPDAILPLGITPGGVTEVPIPLSPLPRRLEVASVFDQAVFVGAAGNHVSNPSAGVILDAGLAPLHDDCDENGVEDVLDLAAGTQSDRDGNGVPDACDIALGNVTDCDGDGVPDGAQGVGHELVDFVPTDVATRNRLGTAIDVEGGTLVATENGGAALVFERDAQGIWPTSETVELQPSVLPAGFSAFGRSAGLAGDTIVVGMTTETIGMAFVFERVAGVWTETAILSPPAVPGGNARFGDRLALDASGDLVAISSWESQRVYLYRRDVEGDWAQEALLTPPPGTSGYGLSLDLDGDTLVVGAPWTSTVCSTIGEVYVYERGRAGTWSQVARLRSPRPRDDDRFGRAVALDGTTLAIGAPYSTRSGFRSGDVFVYERGASGWELADSLGYEPLASFGLDGFGYELDLDGSTLAVLPAGAPDGVLLFDRTPAGTWSLRSFVTPSSPATRTAVALDGSTVVLAGSDDDTYGANRGRVLLFVEPDCDRNGVPDACDLATGGVDADGNGVLDACEH